MGRILNILINPFFLSLIFSSVIIYLLPPVFDKYTLEIKSKARSSFVPGSRYYFYDLDNDGYSEQIIISNHLNKHAMVYLRNHEGKTIDQWNFEHELATARNNYWDDYDGSGLKKIFVFTISYDSILLSSIDPLGSKKRVIKNRFIEKVKKTKGEFDYSIARGRFADLNGDSIKEFIFSINAGFGLFPRKLYVYDIKNDSLYKSVELGNQISDFSVFDLNKDGSPEIIVDTWASNNYINPKLNLNSEFTDTTAWLFVLDSKLDFFFKPIVFNFTLGSIFSIPIKNERGNYIISLAKVYGDSDFKTSLFKINPCGEITGMTKLPVIESIFSARYGKCYLLNDKIVVSTTQSVNFFYNMDLELLEERNVKIKEQVGPTYYFYDLNNDNNSEIIIRSSNSIYITDKNFNNKIFYDFNTEKNFEISKIELDENHPQLFVKSGQQLWTFEYKTNPLYIWHYPIYFGIFMLILLINLLIQKVQKAQIKKNFERQQEITELQLKTIRNQMEPHFTFNAINSIASVIYEEKKEVAYNYFTKISKLIRQTLESSDQVYRTLEKELEFVRNYLEIQQFRFSEKFDFKINVDEEINITTKVPKMVLQTYAENAVKHGLAHLNGKGNLEIEVTQNKQFLICRIDDNGIGRQKAKEIGSTSTGKGVKIMEKYYSLFNSYNKTRIEYEIIDKVTDDGIAQGTMVIVKIPIFRS